VTTSQGITYAGNNGIGSFTSQSAFDAKLALGGFLTATPLAPSLGTFDTAGESVNYSVLSKLGIDNAISDITFSYNNVTYTDVWTQDAQYSAEQGGSATTNIVVYDSLGNPKEITVTMSLVDRDSNFSTYRWYADSFDDTDANWQVDPASKEITTNSSVGTGTIRFDANGNFVKGVEYSETAGIELSLRQQGVSDTLRIGLTQGLSKNATQDLDFSELTQVAATGSFNLKNQDGSAPGTLESFTTTLDGVIQGVYSNGVVRDIARLALALVPNQNGLVSMGSNLFYTSPSSGNAQIGFAGVGGRGSILSASLETSNVDLSEEFTELITTERGFQANSRVITTSDEMLQELLSLNR
jgi:flagellar hook protein FlgE